MAKSETVGRYEITDAPFMVDSGTDPEHIELSAVWVQTESKILDDQWSQTEVRPFVNKTSQTSESQLSTTDTQTEDAETSYWSWQTDHGPSQEDKMIQNDMGEWRTFETQETQTDEVIIKDISEEAANIREWRTV